MHQCRLEGMPEIERENILAARLEEMQKLKDSAQLDAMFKMAGMDDDSNRKKRQAISSEQPVVRRAQRGKPLLT